MSWNNTKAGLMTADTADIEAEVKAVFNAAFPGINTDPSTPQGQLITFITDRLTSAQAQITYMSNIFTKGGEGAYLSNWAETFYGVSRKGESVAMVDIVISGLAGTIVPIGFQVSDGASAIFTSKISSMIDSTGNVTVTGYAPDINQGQVLKNTLTTVVTPVTGVERVTNPFDSSSPISIETDSAFYRRCLSLSPQFLTTSMFGSGLAQVADLTGVVKVGGYENLADTPMNVKGEILPAHSVNYIVQGGDIKDITETILKSKNPGCAIGGNVTAKVQEPISGQYYDVAFFRPTDINLKCAVTVQVAIGDNRNYQDLITIALENYINALTFGAVIYPINAVTALENVQGKVLDLKMAKDDGSLLSYDPIELKFAENAVLPIGNISVTVVDV